MKFHTAVALLTTSAAVAATWAMPAAAQKAPTPAASSAGATDNGAIPDIVVTAQRRSENLQRVPVAVNAATAETLNNLGVRSTADIAMIAPAVTFAVGLGGGAPTIRSVGGTGAGTDEAANALYIDGVYMPSPQGMVFQFNNIQRIEVLKGPQGTLFGRNASGGLIQIITPDPSTKPALKVEAGYSNYNTFHAAGTVEGGLTDSLAVSVTGIYDNQAKGWGRNVTTGNDAYKGSFYGGRAKVVWHAGPSTKVTGTAMYSYVRAAGIQGGSILAGETVYAGGGNYGFYNQGSDTPNAETSNTDYNYALTINHDMGWATFNSITSRDVSTSRLVVDSDFGPFNRLVVDLKGPKRSWTQEFQVASASGSPVTWLVGLFYYHGAWYQDPSLTVARANAAAAVSISRNDSRQVTDSYAAYGQTTFPVTPTTNITLGLRYTIDKRAHDVTTSSVTNPAIAVITIPTAHAEDKKLTWRFALDQRLGENVLAYASYSRGFKSGLYNIGTIITTAGVSVSAPPVAPQTIDAYEIGLKSELFDRRVRLNLSAFHYDGKDIQIRTIIAGVATPVFYNAAKQHTDGVEAELAFRVTPRFTLQGNVAWMSGKYGDFPNAIYYTVNTGVAPYTAAGTFGLTQLAPQQGAGKDTVYTPHWVTNLSAQYKLPTSAGDFTFAASWTYNDGFYFDPQNRLANPSYNQVNGTMTYEPTENMFVRLYVNNLLKEKYYTTIQPTGTFGDNYFPAPPRTYGMTVGVKF